MFLALKNHFTQESYDIVKYRGKTNATINGFEKRKDRLQFAKLSRKVSDDDMQYYIIANIIEGKSWIGQFLEEDAELNFQKFKNAYSDIIKTVNREVRESLDGISFSNFFKVDKYEYPHVVLSKLDDTLSYLTLVVLNNFVQFVPKYNEAYAGDEVWSSMALMIDKLTPFINYDKKEMKNILRNFYND